jgi:hypothetical protein
MPVSRSTLLRNELFIRVDDRLWAWIDDQAHQQHEGRSTYVRRRLEELAKSDLPQGDQDGHV